jgi:hypothetical protein
MKVKEFIKKLQEYNQEAEIFVSCDEELNSVYKDVQAEYLDDEQKVVIWGNSGSEVDF